MGIFGWSYPPGVTGNEPELTGDYGPCDVCGKNVDDCICPECPVCGAQGDPACYEKHGLVRTPDQIAGRAALDEIIRRENEAEEAMCREMDEAEEAAEKLREIMKEGE